MVLRLVFCGLFAVCCSGVYSEDISSLGPPGSILVFGDEFNEAALDTDMWGFGINEKNLNTGLQKAQIYGRFQIISNSPIIILDIAHNEQSVKKLKENLNTYYPSKNYHAVFSVLKDKKVKQI